MRVEIVAVGNEVLQGAVTENNSLYLSRQLAAMGLRPWRITVLPDDVGVVSGELAAALARSGVIIVTGGLGPTVDDVTKEAALRALGCGTELRVDIVREIERRFTAYGREMPPRYRDQGRIPRGAHVLPNAVGLAVGLRVRTDGSELVLLPGVPAEMRAMFTESVRPYLAENRGEAAVRIRTFALVETEVEERLVASFGDALVERLSIVSTPEGVDVYIPGDLAGTNTIGRIRSAMGSHCYGTGDISLQEIVVRSLAERGLRLAVAESVTGGLLASTVVSVPGASDSFTEALVTYSNGAKQQRLGVDAESLKRYGAVSREVCIEMAQGVRRRAGTDCALSTTGIAGPGGATESKPAGLCFIGLVCPDALFCRRLMLPGDRDLVRRRVTFHALDMLRLYLAGEHDRLDPFAV